MRVGQNKRLRLSGRPSESTGILATSRLFTLGDQVLAFFPQVPDSTVAFVLNVFVLSKDADDLMFECTFVHERCVNCYTYFSQCMFGVRQFVRIFQSLIVFLYCSDMHM